MTDTATLLDWLAAFLLVSGAFFSLVAGVGLFGTTVTSPLYGVEVEVFPHPLAKPDIAE